ncbi:MAG: transcription antitermination factor NusB [Chloroflexota bacterium]
MTDVPELAADPATAARDAARDARRLALGAVFEAEFGLRTASRILERRLAEEGADPSAAVLARTIVDAVVAQRDAIDARIEQTATRYPVVQLARIDRSLLRCAIGELLHCPATPTRVAIADWVEMARRYSGEPTRRLMNGILGRIAADRTATPPGARTPPGVPGDGERTTSDQEGAPT